MGGNQVTWSHQEQEASAFENRLCLRVLTEASEQNSMGLEFLLPGLKRVEPGSGETAKYNNNEIILQTPRSSTQGEIMSILTG